MIPGHVYNPFNMQSIVRDQNNYLSNPTSLSLAVLKGKCIVPGVVNAWKDVDFGKGNSNGIFGATPVCLLHTFLLRFCADVFNFYMDVNGKSCNTKKKLAIEQSLPTFISNNFHQSSRNFPRLSNFQTILTRQEKSKTDANELYARVFATFLFSLTTYSFGMLQQGSHNAIQPNNIRRHIRLLEKTLSVYQFLHQNWFKKSMLVPQDGNNESFSSVVLTRYLKLYNKLRLESGNNSVIPKFHYIQHIFDDMKLYGSTRNYDGATSESNFKLMFKKPTSQTQKRHRVFDEQFLKNYHEQRVLWAASARANITDYIMNGEEIKDRHDDSNDYLAVTNNIPFVRKNMMSANFTVHREAKNNDCDDVWFRWKAKKKNL